MAEWRVLQSPLISDRMSTDLALLHRVELKRTYYCFRFSFSTVAIARAMTMHLFRPFFKSKSKLEKRPQPRSTIERIGFPQSRLASSAVVRTQSPPSVKKEFNAKRFQSSESLLSDRELITIKWDAELPTRRTPEGDLCNPPPLPPRPKLDARRVDESARPDGQVLPYPSKIGPSTPPRRLFQSLPHTPISRLHNLSSGIRKLDIHPAFRQTSDSPSLLNHDSPSSPSSYKATLTSSHSNPSSVTSPSISSESSALPAPLFNLANVEALSPQNRVWGEGFLKFDWELSQEISPVIEMAFECLSKQAGIKFSSKPIKGITSWFLLGCYITANVAIVIEYLELTGLSRIIDIQSAEVAWNLLYPNTPSLRLYPPNKEFCKYFVHLCFHSLAHSDLPFQIPISIRCKLDTYYCLAYTAWQKLHEGQSSVTDEAIAKHIDAIFNPYTRGLTLLAFLEITIVENDPLKGSTILKAVIRQSQSLACLVYGTEEQLANLLATSVRAFGFKILRDPCEPWDESACHNMLYFFQQIWNLCTPFYQVSLSERPTLFAAVIAKLEGIEIAFGLWIFLEALNSDPRGCAKSSIRELYRCMEVRFLCLHPEPALPWLLPAFCTMHFLLLATRRSCDCPFFDLLHLAMVACCGTANWESVWRISDKTSEFERLVNLMHARRQCLEAMLKYL